ncbi:MAG: FmdB family zinc ribbon protein [Rhodothermia bacterium]
MPTYVYKREDGTTFEVMQRITDDALATCPTTGQKVKRVIGGGAGLIFKGKGFYITDYARDKAPTNKGESGDHGVSGSKEAAKSDSSDTSKSESKSTSSTSQND